MEVNECDFQESMRKLFCMQLYTFDKVFEFESKQGPAYSREKYNTLQINPALFVCQLDDTNLKKLFSYLFNGLEN